MLLINISHNTDRNAQSTGTKTNYLKKAWTKCPPFFRQGSHALTGKYIAYGFMLLRVVSKILGGSFNVGYPSESFLRISYISIGVVAIFERIGQLTNQLRAKKITGDLTLRCSEGYSILQRRYHDSYPHQIALHHLFSRIQLRLTEWKGICKVKPQKPR